MPAAKHDNFLADITRPSKSRLGYLDGFRFGFGFFIAGLLITLVLAALATAVVLVFHLQ